MKRLLSILSLACLLAVAGFAQRRGGFGHGMGGHGMVGHGMVGHGGFQSGFHGNFHAGVRNRFFFPRNRFAFPIFFSDFGGWDYPFWGGGPSYDAYNPYASSYQPQPNIIVIYPQPPQPAPQVVIQESGPPSTVRYETRRPDPQPDSDPDPPIFSLAFKDHSVSRAAAYWVVGQTLHYVTTQGKRYAVPLSQVDRPASMKLNHEHGVAFGLPS